MSLPVKTLGLAFLLLIAMAVSLKAQGTMLDDQIRNAFETAYPDCITAEDFRLMPIHVSGGPTIRGVWNCSGKRKVSIVIWLTKSPADHDSSRRGFFMRSIMPPTKKVEGIGEHPFMVTTNGVIEIQFSKGNLIYSIETEFPPDRRKKGPYYYHTGPVSEENYAVKAAKTIDAAAAGIRVFSECENTFAWPARDYGFEPEDQLFSAIAQGNVARIRQLSDSGVRLEMDFGRAFVSNGDEKHKPLHIAVLQGCIESVRILVEAGAKVDSGARLGVTPLMLAAGTRNLEVFDYLISKGADIRAKTEYGANIAHNVIISWLDRRIDVSVEDKLIAVESMLRQAKAAGIDFDERDSNNGNSPLALQMESCGGSDWCYKITQMLIDYGVNVNIQDSSGRTPLYKTIERSNTQQDLKVIRLLLANGADPNIKNKEGQSLLGYLDRQAVLYANDGSTQKAIAELRGLLIDAGAKP